MELAKSFEPADIERRWYPVWESRGYFAAGLDTDKADNFCILLPPPNVTGTLHMGHGFNQTIMDALTRYHRMRGDNTLWQPGTDHAGIATQIVVERQLDAQGISRHDLGREKFLEKVWEWKEYSGDTITRQMRRLGTSPGLVARALHHGCRAVEDRHRNLRPPVQRRPDLSRQAPGELGPEAAHRRVRPRSRQRGRRRLHVGDQLSVRRRQRCADRRDDAPGNHARRRRRRGQSRGRTLQAPDRQARPAAAVRPHHPGHRRRLCRQGIRHRLRQDHAGARLQRLAGRPAPRPGADLASSRSMHASTSTARRNIAAWTATRPARPSSPTSKRQDCSFRPSRTS